MRNISEIVDLIKELKNLNNDTQVAEALGMTRTALSNHKSRGTIPFEAIVTYCDCEKIPIEWLLTGTESKYCEKEGVDMAVGEDISSYTKNPDDLICIGKLLKILHGRNQANIVAIKSNIDAFFLSADMDVSLPSTTKIKEEEEELLPVKKKMAG